jgi:hypothetical protein
MFKYLNNRLKFFAKLLKPSPGMFQKKQIPVYEVSNIHVESSSEQFWQQAHCFHENQSLSSFGFFTFKPARCIL